MKKRIDGPAVLLGDDIGIEDIYPSRYGMITATSEMAQHILEGHDSEMASNIEKGCIIVAGSNFGYGTCRAEAIMAIKAAGVACIIASSFSRGFYRNAINQGIPLVENSDAVMIASSGETVAIDFEKGEIILKKKILQFKVFPEIIVKILASGGLIPLMRKSLGK